MTYTQLYCKILLSLGRLFGVTFGGLRIAKRDKRKIRIHQRINFNVDIRLKVLSYLVLASIGLLLIVNTVICLFFDNVEFEAPIQQLLYFTVASIAFVDTMIFLWTQKSGIIIFEFIETYCLSIKQFLVLLFVIFWAIFSFALMTASDILFCFSELEVVKNSNFETNSLNLTKSSSDNSIIEVLLIFYYVGMLPTILSFILQITISLVAFWHLKDSRKKYFANFDYQFIDFNNSSGKRISGLEIDKNLELNSREFIKEFLNFRQRFQTLDSKLSFVILSKFVFLIVYLLYFSYMANIAHFHRWLHLTQTLLTLATLIAFCWIHGLPHDLSKQLRQDFDFYLAFNQEVDLNALKTKLIFSKSTVGFHLLGVKYDKSIIGPVFAFILSYIVILVQTRK